MIQRHVQYHLSVTLNRIVNNNFTVNFKNWKSKH